jgi:hypothetical protein
MGLQVEFNSVLALREHGSIGYLGTETVPSKPEEGIDYAFLKSDHRVYPVGKLIPLVVTEGNCKFSRLVGFVKITNYAVANRVDSELIVTGGNYSLVRKASAIESDIYLKFSNSLDVGVGVQQSTL